MAYTRLGPLGLPAKKMPVHYALHFEEGIGLSMEVEPNPSGFHLHFEEAAIGVTDSRIRYLHAARTESCGVSDTITRHLQRGIIDGISAHDIRRVEDTQFLEDAFGGEDAYERTATFARGLSDTVLYAEVVTPKRKRVLYDYVDFSEGFDKKLTKNLSESITIHDTLLRNANAVMFDLVVRSDVLTPDNLDEVTDSPPVGYTPFKTFYPGDYNYRYGIYGVRLRGVSTGQVGVSSLQLNVDVPDVTERGDATVTALEAGGTGEHSVTFTKTFTQAPTVYPVWSSGPAAAAAEIVSVSTTGFVFKLRDISSPMTYVEGTITWAAIGY